jgi:hypothetical protein
VLHPGASEERLLTELEHLAGVRVDSVSLEKEGGAFVVIARVRGDGGERLGELLTPIARLEEVATLRRGDVGE